MNFRRTAFMGQMLTELTESNRIFHDSLSSIALDSPALTSNECKARMAFSSPMTRQCDSKRCAAECAVEASPCINAFLKTSRRIGAFSMNRMVNPLASNRFPCKEWMSLGFEEIVMFISTNSTPKGSNPNLIFVAWK